MKVLYEGTIGVTSFMMTDDSTIEVWGNNNNDTPESYIYVKPGSIRCEKDFHTEISFWYMKNVG